MADTISLYGGYTTNNYSDANVIALLSDYQNDINVNGNITATGNVSGNIVIANSWYWGNGINLINTLYSNANAQTYLPTYTGNTAATLTQPTQTYITAIGPQVNLTAASNINAAGNWINNLATPTRDGDAANKAYVDSIAQGLAVKAAVNAATTTTLPAYTYNNGPLNDGVGATITSIAQGVLTVDGYVAQIYDRILVKNETSGNAIVNGIYTVTRQGPGSTWQLTRSTDMNQPQEFYGAFMYVAGGATLSTTNWVCTNPCSQPITIGLTAITFSQISGIASLVAGNGITINGTTISTLVNPVTLTYSAVANVGNVLTVNPTALTNLNIGNATGNTLSLTTSLSANSVNATGSITGSVINANTVTANVITGNIVPTGNVYSNNFIGSLIGNVTGAVTGNLTGNVVGNVTGNITTTSITSASTLTVTNGISANGNINVGNSYILGNVAFATGFPSGVTYGNANVATYLPVYNGNIGVDNITTTGNATGNIGSPTNQFNTIFAKATAAQYADLAEMYLADEALTPGTVVEIGGSAEVRATTSRQSTAVAGVVSTNPSYLMNSAIQGEFPVAVALTGRVPCRVIGTIRKGDLLVSSPIDGVATAGYSVPVGSVIGKALQDYDSFAVGTIEVLVGRV